MEVNIKGALIAVSPLSTQNNPASLKLTFINPESPKLHLSVESLSSSSKHPGPYYFIFSRQLSFSDSGFYHPFRVLQRIDEWIWINTVGIPSIKNISNRLVGNKKIEPIARGFEVSEAEDIRRNTLLFLNRSLGHFL
jgi:competence transcription factor ComK